MIADIVTIGSSAANSCPTASALRSLHHKDVTDPQ
jgi:hypothetical protein